MLEFIRTDAFLIIIFVLNIILLIWAIISNVRIKNVNKNTKEFMTKLGNGKDIRDDLKNYMDRVIELEKALSETNSHCKLIDKQLKTCFQKVGIVRYNAYKDTGSNLSFAVALLDEKDNGVVFNGIYSREMSNTYAKPIENGKSSYNLSEEEAEAVLKAVNDNGRRM